MLDINVSYSTKPKFSNYSNFQLNSPAIVPGQGLLPSDAVWEYREARGAGMLGQDCAVLYNKCPMDAQNILNTVHSMGI